MPSHELITRTFALLGGLIDLGGAGAVGAPFPPVTLIAPGDGAAAVRDRLAAGERPAMVIALDGPGGAARIVQLLQARRRVASAERQLTAGGATRVRAVAVVPDRDTPWLIYELGPRAQTYVEAHVVLEAPQQSALARVAKRLLTGIGGVHLSAACVVVVGETA